MDRCGTLFARSILRDTPVGEVIMTIEERVRRLEEQVERIKKELMRKVDDNSRGISWEWLGANKVKMTASLDMNSAGLTLTLPDTDGVCRTMLVFTASTILVVDENMKIVRSISIKD